MTTPARLERQRLCDLMLEVGPDAPTLCGDWTTRDLAAHLVVRERRPDAAAGIVVKRLAGRTEAVQAKVASQPWDQLVDSVRSGPPKLSPTRVDAVDVAVNTIEFFVHHEDVRRAADGWVPRDLDEPLVRDLHRALSRMARLLARQSPTGLVAEPTDVVDPPLAPITVKEAEPSVTLRGPVGELVLFLYGRQEQAEVRLDGPDDAVAMVRAASFGV
ncbi:MAG: TIGR03085 family metal-binding protein [Ilumatobacteraceae bacterium]|jgi:uncharacterized protein (TIGR03085 family)|nr:TIGR03085 family metal-binding protein [Ilumatobacteraceae bacterium]